MRTGTHVTRVNDSALCSVEPYVSEGGIAAAMLLTIAFQGRTRQLRSQ